MIVYLIIVFMLAISASIIFFCTLEANKRKFRYPVIHCEDIEQEYKCAEEGFGCEDMDGWIKDATDEYHVNRQKQKLNKATNYVGSMQCLCQFYKEKDSTTGGNEVESLTIPDDLDVNGGEDIMICNEYFFDKIYSKVLGQSIAFIIIAVNIVLKTVIIKLIEWIGEDTISERLASITNGVFYAQFFNTGILLLLVNANMTEHPPHFFTNKINSGRYYDYMPAWYSDVGQKITQTMLINAIMPFVTLTTGFLIPKIKRGLDTKFSFNMYKTKKTSMAQFKDLYSGGEYTIHFKYSGIINVVYITMMYGLGMPILFVLAAFNFFNQWCCERIIVAYQVKLPAALDDKLTKNAINMLKWAPILFLSNGYWMVTNQQIFENSWSYINSLNDHMLSNHVFSMKVNQGTPA